MLSLPQIIPLNFLEAYIGAIQKDGREEGILGNMGLLLYTVKVSADKRPKVLRTLKAKSKEAL